MVNWFRKQLKKKSLNDKCANLNVKKVIGQWFDYLTLYYEAYGYSDSAIQEKVHPLMKYEWRYSSPYKAFYASEGVVIWCGRDSFLGRCIGNITIQTPDKDICVWENGQWVHEMPEIMKEKVYTHLLTIRQFNLDCKKIKFSKLAAEVKQERKQKEQIEKENRLKSEQEALIAHFQSKS